MKKRELVFRTGRVWFGDLPKEYWIETEFIKEHIVSDTKPTTVGVRAVCLKDVRHGGVGRSGILGCQFTPVDSEHLIIRAGVKNELAEGKIDYAYLKERLADAVLDEATLTVKSAKFLGSGILQFSHASCHPVDSGPLWFRYLARSTIMLLDPIHENISAAEAYEFLRTVASSTRS